MTDFFFFQRNLIQKLTPTFLKVETIEWFLVKQPLAVIKVTEAAIYRRFLQKAKSKKVGKIPQN